MNLSLHAGLKRLMKVQCASIDKDVSEVTEDLYRQYLQSQGVRVAETPSGEPRPSNQKPVRYSKRKRK